LDHFSVQIPEGWVIEDMDNTNSSNFFTDPSLGTEQIATLCMEQESLPGFGGTYQCVPNTTSPPIYIIRYADLHSRPEVKTLERQNRTITALDLLPLKIKILSEDRVASGLPPLQNLRINNTTDVIVNVTDSQTNQTLGTAPAEFVEMTYELPRAPGVPDPTPFTFDDDLIRLEMYDLLVLGNNTNTGYEVFAASIPMTEQVPAPVKQIMDSFSLVE
jgi:hypothetical protein